MKIKNFTVVNMINTLNMFSEKKLPQKISFAITKNLISLQKDYECYIESLNKLFSHYDEYMVRDEENHVVLNDNGIPIVDSNISKEFNEEIVNLLNIEIEKELYYISEDVFDYEDNIGHYDSLSAADIMNLQAILCMHERNDDDVVVSD